MKKIFLLSLFWILSLIIVSIYTFENPETMEEVKQVIKSLKKDKAKIETGNVRNVIANAFNVKVSKVISFKEKTAFIIHDEQILDFNKKNLKIYIQNGTVISNLESKKLNLPNNFTKLKNGGVKTVFIYDDNEFALISSSDNECFYASIVFIKSAKEVFKTKCLPTERIDFNGLGSSNIHLENKIYLTIGAPEQRSRTIRNFAQDNDNFFGKIVEIDKTNLDKIILNNNEKLDLKIFTLGHRNPQGLTKIKDFIFSVEHGPKGGDELNKIIEGKNYGWPKVSYGTQYTYDEGGKYYQISHENNQFEEPLFALVPSVGLSGLNTCPKILKEYYKKPCLMALSLFGNSLRQGKSILIYLLNENLDKVHSVEKIRFGDDLKLRHFVTNSKNELYEDKNGSIFISADGKGIYKVTFLDFRN